MKRECAPLTRRHPSLVGRLPLFVSGGGTDVGGGESAHSCRLYGSVSATPKPAPPPRPAPRPGPHHGLPARGPESQPPQSPISQLCQPQEMEGRGRVYQSLLPERLIPSHIQLPLRVKITLGPTSISQSCLTGTVYKSNGNQKLSRRSL
ncbi:hypothetical protein AAFF_G00107870 [Aldrovandia affinis]|uniref:Uncharacterized protein n=1 Tax=Aldrovandia affinis TaxID=143900 RepID=A0AAD7RUH7_9TELE|nr:hypothetical protein AAFF_G00107870 [Aldrovandia affinis]